MQIAPPESRFFSLLSVVFGLGAALVALSGAPWGALGLAAAALVTTGLGLLRAEGLGALAGAGLATAALLGAEAVLGALLTVALFVTLAAQRRGDSDHPS